MEKLHLNEMDYYYYHSTVIQARLDYNMLKYLFIMFLLIILIILIMCLLFSQYSMATTVIWPFSIAVLPILYRFSKEHAIFPNLIMILIIPTLMSV